MGVAVVVAGVDETSAALATAALAACAAGSVAVVKLVQTGLASGRAGELARIQRLVTTAAAEEFARYPDRLLPRQAARAAGTEPLAFADAVRRVLDLDAAHATVLVRGAAGLLAPYADDGWTVVDLAHAVTASVVLVAPAGLPGLEWAQLATAVLDEQGLPPAGIVLTEWPADPADEHRWAVAELWRLSTREVLAGVLPPDAGEWTPRDFRRRARAVLARPWGGTFDARAFVARHAPG